jgi:hypothetical protein
VTNMKKFKKLIILGAAVLLIGATSVSALAAAYGSPAEILAGLTGRTTDSVIAEKTESGTTYGAIANDSGVLDQFKAQMLELKKADLDARVASGRLTQAQADAILAAMEANMADCDGTGSGKGTCGIGGMGGGFGAGTRGGMGSGRGMGRGAGACGTFGG